MNMFAQLLRFLSGLLFGRPRPTAPAPAPQPEPPAHVEPPRNEAPPPRVELPPDLAPPLPVELPPEVAPPPPVSPPPAPAPDPDRLSPNFTLSEMCESYTARRLGIDNTAPPDIAARLKETARQMEKVRDVLGGKPIGVNSGYRCVALNDALKSSRASAHIQGYAVDFVCPSFGTPYDICMKLRDSPIMSEVDQLIHEFGGWVHISFDPRRRRDAFTLFTGGSSSEIIRLGSDGKPIASA